VSIAQVDPAGDQPGRIPIPSLLVTGAVHHHLIREKSRTQVGLLVEAGDVRECHHVALLIGYGAAAVNPYLAIASVRELPDLTPRRAFPLRSATAAHAEANLLKALNKGLLKIMSKMGVSTVASYTGAQIFEAIGLGEEVIGTCFAGTTSRLAGSVSPSWPPRSSSAAASRAPAPWHTGGWRRAENTSGGGRASRTCSARKPCSGCSTPRATVVMTYSRSTRAWSTSSRGG